MRADIVALMGDHPGAGNQSAAHGFTEHQNIGGGEMLAGRHFTGAPESLDDFVKY